MIAKPAVTFKSFVGGVTPNRPEILARPRYKPMVPRYGAKVRQYFSPSVFLQNPLMKPTKISATIWRRPGLRFKPCVSQMARTVRMAMMTQVMTVDCGTGIPPNSGMSNAILFCSCALSSALISSNDASPLSCVSICPYFSHRKPVKQA